MRTGKLDGTIHDLYQIVYDSGELAVYDSYTKLMLHFDDADTATSTSDSSQSNHTITFNGTAQVSSDQKKFGRGSLLLDGDSDDLTLSNSSDWDVLASTSDDWTVEAWVYTSTSGYQRIFSQYADGSNRWGLYLNDLYPGFNSVDGGSTEILMSSASPIESNTWTHIAMIKVGTALGIYANGEQVAWYDNSSTLYTSDFTGTLYIGQMGNAGQYFGGWIDEMRIINSNPFNASPNSGMTNTVTVPTSMYMGGPLISLTIDNLHGDTDEEYKYIARMVNGYNGSAGFKTVFNYDVGANYGRQIMYGTNTTAAANRLTGLNAGTFGGNGSALGDVGIVEGTIYAKSGEPRLTTVQDAEYINGTTVEYSEQWSNIWNNSVDEMTSISIDATQLDGIGAGSRIILLRKVDASGSMQTGELDTLGDVEDTWQLISSFDFVDSTTDSALLMHFDGNEGAEEIVDSAPWPSGHVTTQTNTASLSATAKKFGTTSCYFDGNSDFLNIPDSEDWNVVGSTTQDYTIDLWVKHTDHSGVETYVGQRESSGTMDAWLFRHDDGTGGENGVMFVALSADGVIIKLVGDEITDTLWHHVALVKKTSDGGATVEYGIYQDGVQTAYTSDTSTDTYSSNLYIGFEWYGDRFYFDGYMDDVRIQTSNAFNASPNVGTTDTITVPTSAHTADADTKLLLHMETQDKSPYNHIPDFTGTAHLEDGHEFGQAAGYFDGNSDYLEIADSDDWDICGSNSDNWTIDCWVKLASVGAHQYFVGQYEDGANYFIFGYNFSSGLTFQFLDSTTGADISIPAEGNLIVQDEWTHIAFCKVSNEYGLYMNGEQQSYVQDSDIGTLTASLEICQKGNDTYYLNGHMKEFRIQHSNILNASPNSGKTDVVAIPVAQATTDADTKLLLHMDKPTDINNPLNTALRLDGTGDYLELSNNADWNLGGAAGGDFTIEFWLKWNSKSGNQHFFSTYDGGSGGYEMFWENSNLLYFWSGGGTTRSVSWTPVDNRWYHIAVVRETSTITIYIDGDSIGTIADGDFDNDNGPLYIGARGTTPERYINGWVKEFRISKGIARYTSDFTPSITAFTPDSNTKLLLHLDEAHGTYAASVTDSSPSAHTVQQSGDTKNIGMMPGTWQNGAGWFDGNSDYLQIDDHADWDMGGTDFCADFWVKAQTIPNGDWLVSQYVDGTHSWRMTVSNTTFEFVIEGGSTGNSSCYGSVPNTGISDYDWHHVVFFYDVSDSSLSIYMDGQQIEYLGSVTNTTSFAGDLFVNSNGSSYHFPGWMKEVRISRSNPLSLTPDAGFTDTYTVPTSQYTSDSNTKLLLHMNAHGPSVLGSCGYWNNTTSTYLEAPYSTDWEFGSNVSFTIDGYLRFNNIDGTGDPMISGGGGANGWTLNATTSYIYFYVNGAYSAPGFRWSWPETPVDDRWYHWAVVRDTATTYLFVDGVLVNSSAGMGGAIDCNSDTLQIGQQHSSDPFSGWLRNQRITKGAALWTTNFVPPTDDDYTTDSNTKLFWRGAGTPGDTSGSFLTDETGNHTLTNNSSNVVCAQLEDWRNTIFKDDGNTGHYPKGPNSGTQKINWITVFGEGVASFDGTTGTYLLSPDSPDWDLGTAGNGDFTLECWVYFKVNQQSNFINGFSAASNGWQWYFTNANQIGWYAWGAISTISFVPRLNEWYHMMLVRDGSTVTSYVNGESIGTQTDKSAESAGIGLEIGAINSYHSSVLNGYMDEVRVSKGVARQTTDFIPPSSAYSDPDSDTKLLLHFDEGTSPIDDSSDEDHDVYGHGDTVQVLTSDYRETVFIDASGHIVVPNGTAKIGWPSVFGESALWLDGNSDYVSMADSSAWGVAGSSSQDYTMDMWVRLDDHSGYSSLLCDWEDSSNHWQLKHYHGNGLRFFVWSGGGYAVDTGYQGGEIEDSDWHHVALTKVTSGGPTVEWGIYLDGSQVAYLSDSSTDTFSGPLYIGEYGTTSAEYLNGNIDEVRIQQDNAFGASPNSGLTDTITPSGIPYADPSGITSLTSVSFDNLDGDTDVIYKLTARIVNGYDGSCVYYMRPNADSAANYGYQQLVGGDTSASAGRDTADTSIRIPGCSNLGDISTYSNILYAKSGYERAALSMSGNNADSSEVDYIILRGYSWNNTSDNITSIGVDCSQTAGFGAGTHIELWKMNL